MAKHGKTMAKHGKTMAKHGETVAKHAKTMAKPWQNHQHPRTAFWITSQKTWFARLALCWKQVLVCIAQGQPAGFLHTFTWQVIMMRWMEEILHQVIGGLHMFIPLFTRISRGSTIKKSDCRISFIQTWSNMIRSSHVQIIADPQWGLSSITTFWTQCMISGWFVHGRIGLQLQVGLGLRTNKVLIFTWSGSQLQSFIMFQPCQQCQGTKFNVRILQTLNVCLCSLPRLWTEATWNFELLASQRHKAEVVSQFLAKCRLR